MNDSTNKPQFDFREVIDRASRRLENAAKIPFSDQAFQELKEQISAYAEELVDASVQKANQHRAESVSSADVQQASQYLVARQSRRFHRALGTFGGLLLGAALSSIVSIVTTNQYRLTLIVITFILTFSGTSLMTIHMVKD